MTAPGIGNLYSGRGWSTNKWLEENSDWPRDKCIHGGGSDTPGLNKDAPSRDTVVGDGTISNAHEKARDYAQLASEAFIHEVFRAIRLQVPDANAAICALIGRSGSAVCKKIQDSPVTTISGFNPPTEGYIGKKFLAAVTGTLSPNLSVRLGTVDCRTVTEQTSGRLDVECMPYANGIFDLTVRAGSGEVLRADKITIYAAKIETLPASANLFDRVKFTITNFAATIYTAILNVFDALGSLLEKSGESVKATATVKDGVSVSVVEGEYVLGASGPLRISAELFSVPASGASASLGKTNAVTVDVRPGVVTSITPLMATAGKTNRFDVYGDNLGSDLGFKLEGCENTKPVEIPGELTTHQAFVCTFPTETVPGKKNGAVGLKDGTPFDKALKAFSVDVSAPPAPTAPLVFYDAFDGSALDMSKWTIEPPNPNGGGVPATYTVAGGFLNVNVPGGSCGSCGVTDGSGFRPNVAPLAGDFEMVISAQELERISRDGTRPLSNVQLVLRDGSYQLGIFVNGDARNNTGAAGHVIYMYSLTPSGQDFVGTRELTVGQYNAYQLRIRRVGTQSYLAYKLDGDTNWTEVAVRQSMPASLAYTPRIWIASGDGGGTRANSSFKAKLDFVTIVGTGGTAASNADALYEPFDGPAINNAKWSNSPGSSASYSISSGLINVGGRTSFDTKGKVVFSGSKVVVEYRAGGTETSVLLVDADAPTANAIHVSNTMYRSWGLFIHASGAFALTGGNVLAEGAYVVSNGRIDVGIKFYRLALEGTKVTLERGVDANSITETLTGAVSTTTTGRRFYLQFGTGTPPYAPGVFDWISVKASNAAVMTSFYVPASANPGIDFVNPFASKSASCAVTATGTWNNGPTLDYGPDGAQGVCGAGCMFPNAPSLALILARSNGSYQVVGSSKTVALSAGERVAFWNNDGTSSYSDNQGSVQATATCE